MGSGVGSSAAYCAAALGSAGGRFSRLEAARARFAGRPGRAGIGGRCFAASAASSSSATEVAAELPRQTDSRGEFRVVVVPCSRRGWVFCPERVLLLAPPGPPPSWAEVRTYLHWQHFSVAAFCYGVASRALHWAEGGFVAMGKADSATRLGRWKRWAYAKGSEWATATVGPEEAFLKSVPEGARLRIVYPNDVPERLVRRRLRY